MRVVRADKLQGLYCFGLRDESSHDSSEINVVGESLVEGREQDLPWDESGESWFPESREGRHIEGDDMSNALAGKELSLVCPLKEFCSGVLILHTIY